jgi:hypothetical protein
MTDWYKVTFDAHDTEVSGKHLALQNDFFEFFKLAGLPKGAAILSKHSEDLSQHFYYFTPQAAKIAKQVIEAYGGVLSERPKPPVHLAVGSCSIEDWQRVWEMRS